MKVTRGMERGELHPDSLLTTEIEIPTEETAGRTPLYSGSDSILDPERAGQPQSVPA